MVWLAVRSSRARRAAWAARMRDVLDEDVTLLGERLGEFDHTDARLGEEGRRELQSALDSYALASDRSSRLGSESDVVATTKALDDGRYALACVEARLEGRSAPARRAPCFFDPRHGVSLEDVDWSPPQGPAHPVPACAACTATVHSGGTPPPREIEVAGTRRPYWEGGREYAPYARGYFSDFGSTMVAVFAGTMMANALFAPTAAAASMGLGDGIATDSSSGSFGGGDFGGGGFSGGDFGGGGFGGGDFGGGDF